MNLDQLDRALVDALPWLSVTVLPVLLIAVAVSIYLYVQTGEEDDYTIADYSAQATVPHEGERRRIARPAHRRVSPLIAMDDPDDILPPAPAGMNAGAPLYAAMTARRWLRQIAAEQQAKASIRPVNEHWASLDGSCWPDCPECARDMTGAFPVVRAA